jgi:hypothetical protein
LILTAGHTPKGFVKLRLTEGYARLFARTLLVMRKSKRIKYLTCCSKSLTQGMDL